MIKIFLMAALAAVCIGSVVLYSCNKEKTVELQNWIVSWMLYKTNKNIVMARKFLTTIILSVLCLALRAQNTNYTPLYTNTSFVKNIDVTKPVGAINGTPQVTNSGSSSYTIPIEMPPGTNGVKPTLSISYSSQRGNGILGYGWNIDGLSSITRGIKNWYNDGKVESVKNTDKDAFFLDGSRLILLSGTYGALGSEYAIENENFSRAKITNDCGNGPWVFDVTTKDGTVLEYGNEEIDKGASVNNIGNWVYWRLFRVIDRNGNYIEYTYDNADNDSRIKEINYTGNINTGLVPYNKVKFEYSIRSDKNTIYETGLAYNQKYLLDKIIVTGEYSQAFKQFIFSYGTDDIHSFLKEISETGTDGTTLNSTILKYGEQSTDLIQTAGNVNGANAQWGTTAGDVYFGDYNGDGLTDIMSAEFTFGTNTSGPTQKFYNNIRVSLNNGTSTLNSAYAIPVTNDVQIINKENYSNSFLAFTSADFNGDGRDDIALTNTTIASKTFNNAEIHYSDGGTSFISNTHPAPIDNNVLFGLPVTYNSISNKWNYYYQGDFNGDGRSDYITFLGKGSSYKAHFSMPSTGSINNEILNDNPMGNQWYGGDEFANADANYVIDFNGDGKSDLMSIQNGTCKIFNIEFNPSYAPNILGLNWNLPPSALCPYRFNLLYTSGYPNKWHKIQFGDFNGDRKTDIITWGKDAQQNSVNYEIAYSTGTNFIASAFTNLDAQIQSSLPSGTSNHCKQLTLGDYNGDGKTDIAYVYSFDSPSLDGEKIHLYYSTGNSFKYYHRIISNSYNYCFSVQSGDLNSDGRSDILWKSNGASFQLLKFQPNGKERLLEKVTNGSNATVQFDYKLLNAGTPFYVQGTIPSIASNLGAGYPVNNVCYPSYNVSSVKTPDGIGGLNEIKYKYENARIHRAGKGFIGFEKVISEDIINDTKTINTSELNNTYYVPFLKDKKIYNLSSNALLNSNISSYSFIPISLYRFVLQPTSQISKDHLQNVTKTINYIYDAFNNITGTTSSINNLENSTTSSTYTANGGLFPYLPNFTTNNNSRLGSPAISKKTNYNYDNLGRLITKSEFAGLPQAVTTNFTYDNFGNVLSSTLSAIGLQPRVNKFIYDSKGRFAISKIKDCNSCGTNFSQTESYSYNALFGLPLTQTTTDCQTTSFVYDGFGKLLKTTLPTGITIYNSISWLVSPNSISKSSIVQQGKPTTEKIIDILGRTIEEKTQSLNSQWISTKTKYNNKGLVVSKTNSHIFGIETPIITNLTYDYYNRLSNETNGINMYNYSYTYNTTNSTLTTNKVDLNGRYQEVVKDASGKISQSADNGGKVRFVYDSWGNQKYTYQNGLLVNTNIYDAYNRQSSKIEANAGRISTKYNAYGELVSQTDAKNNNYVFEYDNLGRLVKRTGGEGITTYEYYCRADVIRQYETHGNPVSYDINHDDGGGFQKPGIKYPIKKYCCNNNITKIIGFNGIIQNFSYDNLGRLIKKDELVDGNNYTFEYGYDIFDNNTSIRYPSGLQINSIYDANGFLVSVYQQGAVGDIYKTNTINGMGQISQYEMGNGLVSNQTYTNGFPTNFSTNGVQDYELVWNSQENNITQRRDNINGLFEDFTYDNLNRLTSSQVVGQPIQNYNYDPINTLSPTNGNIKVKEDAGYYRYTGIPHAQSSIAHLTSTTLPPNNISGNTQTIDYTPFVRVNRITENGFINEFDYDPSYERVKSVLTQNSNLIETKYYFDDYEIQIDNQTGDINKIHYVNAGNGLCAMIVIDQNNYSNTYYVYKDHLGSINTITDVSGNIVAEQNFDAWGRNRNPVDGTYLNIPINPEWLFRGFTGHEHLPQFGLINMNARCYDPVVGKLISPDNYVSNPFATQAYNRYSYANNNPLLFTDPDGNFPWFVPLIFGAVNLGCDLLANNGKMTIGEIALSFGTGAVGGVLAASGAGGIATVGGAFLSAGVSQLNRFLPQIPVYQSDGFSLSISPMIAFGSHGFSAGASINAVASIGDVTLGASYGFGSNSGMNDLGGIGGPSSFSNWGVSGGASINSTYYGASWSTNKFTSGNTNQSVGAIGLQIGDFGIRLDEDFIWDKGDRFRTGGLFATYKINNDVTLAFGASMITGDATDRGQRDGRVMPFGNKKSGTWDNCSETMPGLRGGNMFGGVIYKNQAYLVGNNSEKRLHDVQNAIHDHVGTPYFENMGYNKRSYGFYGSYMQNYLFY